MTLAVFEDYVRILRRRLLSPLPGLAAQLLMAPKGRIGPDYDPEPETARRGAVLLLLYPGTSGLRLPLIQRPVSSRVHSGQIAFPGGAHEAPESFPVTTALRETEEEIGIDAASVQPLGVLSPIFIPPSNFSITPVVGALRASEPAFVPQAGEVDSVLTVDVDSLPSAQGEADVVGSLGRRRAPGYRVGGYTIWGATAMILSEYVQIHSEILKA